jgi:hypothetical protein
MNLRNDRRQKVQGELDFSSTPRGEARQAGREATETFQAVQGAGSPANTNQLMEEVCERENLKEALRRVKANKGSAGVDGMTVGGITDYLKQRWPAIREPRLNHHPRSQRARSGILRVLPNCKTPNQIVFDSLPQLSRTSLFGITGPTSPQ